MPDDDGPVTEQERERLLEALRRHLASGRLDLPQFEARLVQVYRADRRVDARAALDGLPLLESAAGRSRRARRRHGEAEHVQEHWVATDEVFRDPASGRVMRVWVDPVDGVRHYAESDP